MERNDNNRRAYMAAGAVLAIAALIGWYLYDKQQDRIDAERERGEAHRLALVELQTQSGQREADFAARIDALAGEVATLLDTLDQAQASKAQVEAGAQQQFEDMKLSTQQLEQALQERQAKQASLNSSLQQANQEKSELAGQLAAEHEAQRRLRQQIEVVAGDIEQKEAALEDAGMSALRLSYQLARNREEQRQLKADVEELNRQREDEAAHFAILQTRLQQELNESRVEISQLKNRMTVIKLTSEVLFASGSATIRPAGQKVLALIAESLNQYPEREIAIEGHTDSVPIGLNSSFTSNWELSAARSLAAVNFLQSQSQVEPGRLKIVGYGEYRPVASNDTADGRQLNRRIELRLLPRDTG